ncbi:hypothetical protein JWJ88_17240 [Paracoccus methylovorus]|uniref:Twin-arginine translocase TatA/TatE family subunit n=1 Tax=Paracoccus methylovorus TaxID=2812658 RepID=A0ABX7JP12_9RHOB|nr:hypothetical protein [Paracoccus methylovorus]QRZ14709.1 hypothetical protein JWJ88_17240 [Paracoccus methylovorus]
MILALSMLKTLVTGMIMIFVGLAFLPHFGAARLTSLQKFLTEEIERRERKSQ